jgi:nucleotidyltransferase substrate binding protein (TIGR01987 family)
MTRPEIVVAVKNIILKYARPKRIYLFGSEYTGEATPQSDIDIAYDDPDFKQDFLIEEEIGRLSTLVKVDVKNIAKTHSKVIYSANKALRAEDALYNFSRALQRFDEMIQTKEKLYADGYKEIYLDLAVQRFEFTYEMAWKTLKRLLDFLGIDAKYPRAVFQEAYAAGLIKDEAVWLDMIEQRNLAAHIYDEYEILPILDKLEHYNRAFGELKNTIETSLNDKGPQ